MLRCTYALSNRFYTYRFSVYAELMFPSDVHTIKQHHSNSWNEHSMSAKINNEFLLLSGKAHTQISLLESVNTCPSDRRRNGRRTFLKKKKNKKKEGLNRKRICGKIVKTAWQRIAKCPYRQIIPPSSL